MPTPSLDQLKRAIAIKEQIATLEAELANVLGGTATAAPASARLKRKYTKRAEAAADAAPVKAAGKPKRTMSAEGRARIIAAQKARWAKIKKGK